MADRPRTGLLRSAAALGLVAVIGTVLLAGTHQLTEERIAEQERRVVLEQLGQILPPSAYDNSLQDDRITLRDEQFFPGGQEVVAYRARENGEPVAVIFRFKATRGYNGDIGLLAGILADGRLAGVRVTSHSETPGLGDAIEVAKSDWILGFGGRSLGDPEPQACCSNLPWKGNNCSVNRRGATMKRLPVSRTTWYLFGGAPHELPQNFQ
jgi:electron transport complex protein RnfG